MRDGLGDERLDRGDVAGVGLDGEGSLWAAELVDEGVGGGGVGGVVDGDAGALLGEEEGGGAADPLGAAGDQGDFAREGLGGGSRHCMEGYTGVLRAFFCFFCWEMFFLAIGQNWFHVYGKGGLQSRERAGRERDGPTILSNNVDLPFGRSL